MHDKPNLPGPWFHLPTKRWVYVRKWQDDVYELIDDHGRCGFTDNLPARLLGNWTPGIPQPSDDVIEQAIDQLAEFLPEDKYVRPEVAAILRRVFQTGERA